MAKFYIYNPTYCKENKDDIERTNYILEYSRQNIPNKHSRAPLEYFTVCVQCKWANLPYVFNANEKICMMMIMSGSSMPKAEHDPTLNVSRHNVEGAILNINPHGTRFKVMHLFSSKWVQHQYSSIVSFHTTSNLKCTSQSYPHDFLY